MKEDKNQNINEIAKLKPETQEEQKAKKDANLSAISTVRTRRAAPIEPTITATAGTGKKSEGSEKSAKKKTSGAKIVRRKSATTGFRKVRRRPAEANGNIQFKKSAEVNGNIQNQAADANVQSENLQSDVAEKTNKRNVRRRTLRKRQGETTVEFVLRVVAGALILISLLSFQMGYYQIKAMDGSAKDLKFRNLGIHLAVSSGDESSEDDATDESDTKKSDQSAIEEDSEEKDTDSDDASTDDAKSDEEDSSSSEKKSSKKKSSKKKSEEKDPYDIDSYELSYDDVYKVTKHKLNMKIGEVYFNDHKETFYSQSILPGGALKIPGRHVAEDGTIRDEDGYICVAAPLDGSYLSMGDTILTSLGPGKVYDEGTMEGAWIDIYTNW